MTNEEKKILIKSLELFLFDLKMFGCVCRNIDYSIDYDVDNLPFLQFGKIL